MTTINFVKDDNDEAGRRAARELFADKSGSVAAFVRLDKDAEYLAFRAEVAALTDKAKQGAQLAGQARAWIVQEQYATADGWVLVASRVTSGPLYVVELDKGPASEQLEARRAALRSQKS